MTIVVLILLVLALVFLLIELLFIWKLKHDHLEFLVEFHNMERALQISRNKFIDSERERAWLNSQLTILHSQKVEKMYGEALDVIKFYRDGQKEPFLEVTEDDHNFGRLQLKSNIKFHIYMHPSIQKIFNRPILCDQNEQTRNNSESSMDS